VLTTSHLDPVPEHCDDTNLRAMCQRCHLAYDAPLHAATVAAARASRAASARRPAAAELGAHQAARPGGAAYPGAAGDGDRTIYLGADAPPSGEIGGEVRPGGAIGGGGARFTTANGQCFTAAKSWRA
jgi:hypothetical protein